MAFFESYLLYLINLKDNKVVFTQSLSLEKKLSIKQLISFLNISFHLYDIIPIYNTRNR